MLNHIEIYVSDLRKSIEFWQWLQSELGYEQYQMRETGMGSTMVSRNSS
jgi:hypothetical protein